MQNIPLDYTRNVVNGIRASFLSGPPPPPPPPTIDPNLLFDVNFNDSSLDVDYTIDGNPLAFEGVSTPNDGHVTITNTKFISLSTGMPSYLKNTGDQSWVFNFRSENISANRYVFNTLQLDEIPQTGFRLSLYNDYIFFTFFKGPGNVLVGGQWNSLDTDMSIDVQSIVLTYKRIGHETRLYYNGVLRMTIVAPAGNENEVISWEKSTNLYINRFFRYTPVQPTHTHRIAAFDKVLTEQEVEDIYNASQL
jgi:hypothetical protein